MPFSMSAVHQKTQEIHCTESAPDPGSNWGGLNFTHPEGQRHRFIQISSFPLKLNFKVIPSRKPSLLATLSPPARTPPGWVSHTCSALNCASLICLCWHIVLRTLIGNSEIRVSFPKHEHRLLQWLSGKESACRAGAAGDTGLIPGLGRCPGGEHGNPHQYSYLENLMDRGAWGLVHRVTKSQTQLKQLSTHTCKHHLVPPHPPIRELCLSWSHPKPSPAHCL